MLLEQKLNWLADIERIFQQLADAHVAKDALRYFRISRFEFCVGSTESR